MVGGDQAKGDQLVLGERPYFEAQKYIMGLDLPLVHRQELAREIQKIEMEMLRRRPSKTVIEVAAERLANAFPEVLSALISAVPAILQAAPAIVDMIA